MYTVYNTGDIIFFKPNGTVSYVLTSDDLYCNEYGLTKSNFITKMVVHAVCYSVKAIDYILKM